MNGGGISTPDLITGLLVAVTLLLAIGTFRLARTTANQLRILRYPLVDFRWRVVSYDEPIGKLRVVMDISNARDFPIVIQRITRHSFYTPSVIGESRETTGPIGSTGHVLTADATQSVSFSFTSGPERDWRCIYQVHMTVWIELRPLGGDTRSQAMLTSSASARYAGDRSRPVGPALAADFVIEGAGGARTSDHTRIYKGSRRERIDNARYRLHHFLSGPERTDRQSERLASALALAWRGGLTRRR